MLFGFGMAAVAGFLLTAVATWTQTPMFRGKPLALLAAVWIAGRVAPFFPGVLPAGLIAACDLLSLPGRLHPHPAETPRRRPAGVSRAIEPILKAHNEAVITVRGQERYVVLTMDAYQRLREAELDLAVRESRADYLAGLHSASINRSFRITLEFPIEGDAIISADVGDHDSAHR